MNDFLHFDGNPQGVRIVLTLQDIKLPDGEDNFTNCGLNLTYSQVASILKYLPSSNAVDKSSPLHKKAGYFFSEHAKLKK